MRRPGSQSPLLPHPHHPRHRYFSNAFSWLIHDSGLSVLTVASDVFVVNFFPATSFQAEPGALSAKVRHGEGLPVSTLSSDLQWPLRSEQYSPRLC